MNIKLLRNYQCSSAVLTLRGALALNISLQSKLVQKSIEIRLPKRYQVGTNTVDFTDAKQPRRRVIKTSFPAKK